MNRRGLVVFAVFIIALLSICRAIARDIGQWKYASPDMAAYFQTLMQPDIAVSCCGEADMYYADKTEAGPNGELIAVITDTRDDGPLMRPHIEPGTRVVVPPNKIRKIPIPNPTEHTLIFISASGTVYCYEPLPSG